MKKLLPLLLILFVTSCMPGDKEAIENWSEQRQKYPFVVHVRNGTKWDYTTSDIHCDSFQMITNTKAAVWVNGTRMEVIGDRISVGTNKRQNQ